MKDGEYDYSIEVIRVSLLGLVKEMFKRRKFWLGYTWNTHAYVFEIQLPFGLLKKQMARLRDHTIRHESGHLAINLAAYVPMPRNHEGYDKFTRHGLFQGNLKFDKFMRWKYK